MASEAAYLTFFVNGLFTLALGKSGAGLCEFEEIIHQKTSMEVNAFFGLM
jgi:hypothetical protein